MSARWGSEVDGAPGAARWERLLAVSRRFLDERVEPDRAVFEVARAARLDEVQREELALALGMQAGRQAYTAEARDLAIDSALTESLDAEVDGTEADDLEPVEPDLEQLEAPESELLAEHERVRDFDDARRAARRVMRRDWMDGNAAIQVLTAEQEVGLFLLMRAGTSLEEDLPEEYFATLLRDAEPYKAFTALVTHNTGLVKKLASARERVGEGLTFEDIAQHGYVGLIRALRKFNVALGYKFSTYATWWIRQAIDRGIANESSIIRLPVHVRESIEKVRRVQSNLFMQGQSASPMDLSLACGFPLEKVMECLRLSHRLVGSIDTVVGENVTLGDFLTAEHHSLPGPEEMLDPMFDREILRPLLENLSDRTRDVLLYRFGFVDGERWTLQELGVKYGVSRERIRQIEKNGMQDIRIQLRLEPDDSASARRRDRVREIRLQKKRERQVGIPGEESSGEELSVDGQGNAVVETVASAVEEIEMALSGDSLVPGLAKDEQDDAPSAGENYPAWYHRPGHADGGRELGNAAAFAFDADVSVLARETCQNSLDERLTANGQPVQVRYTLHELTGETLARFRKAIQWSDLALHYEAAAAQEQKVGRVIDAGLRDMHEHDRLVLLRVDDYNAAGLTGDDYDDGRFAAVVRRQLDSHKTGSSAGGSYGLGKATLWATSRLGLVLMNSTLSEPHEGRTERRLIGRLDLPWRQVGGVAWAGPAWLGQPDPHSAGANVARSWWADEATVEALHLKRESSEPGTSFLIVGAHDVASLADDIAAPEGDEGEDEDTIQRMHHRLVRALGKNFWAAMTGGGDHLPLLEASVRTLRNGSVVISEERVDPTVAQPSRTRALRAFLEGTTVEQLTEAGQVAATTVPLSLPARGSGRASLGEHRAVLLVTDAEDADGKPNRVVAMRGNRMTVRDSAVPGLPLSVNPFQAVLLTGAAAGSQTPFTKEAEEFLRAAEPPEHNKWGQTEELALAYSPSAYRRINSLTRETNAAIKELVVRPKKPSRTGGGRLAPKLTVGGGKKRPRLSGATLPVLEELQAQVLADGAWQVVGEIRIPAGGHTWRLVPVAKFDVRSGPRPTVAWAELMGLDNCEVVDGTLRFDEARTATFRGVTDPTTHAVRTSLSGLIVELHAGEVESLS